MPSEDFGRISGPSHFFPLRMAYHAGITYATSAVDRGQLFETLVIGSLSATFSTGAAHALEPSAIVKSITALHIRLAHPSPLGTIYGATQVSVSTQIAALRRLLLDGENVNTETGSWFKQAADVRMASALSLSLAPSHPRNFALTSLVFIYLGSGTPSRQR